MWKSICQRRSPLPENYAGKHDQPGSRAQAVAQASRRQEQIGDRLREAPPETYGLHVIEASSTCGEMNRVPSVHPSQLFSHSGSPPKANGHTDEISAPGCQPMQTFQCSFCNRYFERDIYRNAHEKGTILTVFSNIHVPYSAVAGNLRIRETLTGISTL